VVVVVVAVPAAMCEGSAERARTMKAAAQQIARARESQSTASDSGRRREHQPILNFEPPASQASQEGGGILFSALSSSLSE
jgi:hypothetical protein